MVGNGQSGSFWKDKWGGTTPLCKSFLSLFALAAPKKAWVKDVWTVSEREERGKRGVGELEPSFL